MAMVFLFPWQTKNFLHPAGVRVFLLVGIKEQSRSFQAPAPPAAAASSMVGMLVRRNGSGSSITSMEEAANWVSWDTAELGKQPRRTSALC